MKAKAQNTDDNWGNPVTKGLLADNTETKNMSSKDLVTWFKSKGITVIRNTK